MLFYALLCVEATGASAGFVRQVKRWETVSKFDAACMACCNALVMQPATQATKPTSPIVGGWECDGLHPFVAMLCTTRYTRVGVGRSRE